MADSLKAGVSTQVLEQGSVLAALEQSLAMIEFDLQGTVLWANEKFAGAVGYRASELTGMSHKKFCTREFAESREYAEMWNQLRQGKKIQEKIQRVTKDGRVIWLEAAYMPVFQGGRVQAVIKVATDVTVRQENNASGVTTQLRQLSEALRARAEDGMTRNRDLVTAVDRIAAEASDNAELVQSLQKQANAIRSIVQTIRDFATQTNMLALNAAIEAAHAGEYGRGFAIVAGEVRSLAKQVQDAAQEVHQNVEEISASVVKIGAGSRRTEEAVADSQGRIRQALDDFESIGEAARNLDEQGKAFIRLL
ncbi:methyl-accepting chemotaxis protein [Paenibacillus methanolicus]|uniref:PAS domain S-box-containing protein n=1 Tax=Paenibacillus methanolicus TaxID=582686 RepID=A0A5S5BYY5_9BACL|nr:methyl-accepting chemotaxis protein [Paenibacillus methanolicus]TYP72391.1 PAS domain S-box-containing protein [Paenibacillus methanolicus]